jgi:hypothetical protein
MYPMKLIGDMGLVESHFGPFGDNITIGARLVHGLRQSTIGSEIVLDAPDGTPMIHPAQVGLAEAQ